MTTVLQIKNMIEQLEDQFSNGETRLLRIEWEGGTHIATLEVRAHAVGKVIPEDFFQS